MSLGVQNEVTMPVKFARGKGCRRCGNRGTKGRTAAYEIMPMTDTIRAMVLKRCSGAEISAEAVVEGMITMRQSGLRKVLDLDVAPEEMARVLAQED